MRTVSHYEILEKLGEGGMGVVWKARDTRLDRFVAIKFLPPDKTANPDRKMRFAQEARAASALNHPRIITIYDIDHADGSDFIAMEYVSGKTLDQLIPAKGMKVVDAVRYAMQIADALAAAHAAGIVHRDLKPANVMVSDTGQVKVLDFGLAKLQEESVSGEYENTRTIVQQAKTEEGTIVGTACYMSPEQAEGQKVDARSDIFSFGSVLYEMLTGKRAFRGETKVATLAAILRSDPEPVDKQVEGVPRELARIVQRCLRKDPDERAQGMADLRIALKEIKEESESGLLTASPAVTKKRGRKALWIAAGIVAFAAAGVAAYLWAPGKNAPEVALQATLLTSYPGLEGTPSFSPDGGQVVFTWNGEKQDNYDIYVKLLGSGAPLRLTSDPAMDYNPVWSPDGRWIAFIRDRTIVMISPLGGPEREVAQNLFAPLAAPSTTRRFGITWSPDGRWLVASTHDEARQPMALFLVSAESGEKRRLTSPPRTISGDFDGVISPDGRTLAFSRLVVIGSATMSDGDVFTMPLGADYAPAGPPKRITFDQTLTHGIAWTADSKEIVFSSYKGGSSGLWRIPVAGQQKAVKLPVGDHGVSPSISRQGNRLAFEQAIPSDTNVWRVSLTEPSHTPTSLIASTRQEQSARYSPDGRKIAFSSERSGPSAIWLCDADGGNPTQQTSIGNSGSPAWSPDGQRIAFDSLVNGQWQIFTMSARGGKPQQLTTAPASDSRPQWSHDNQWIYASGGGGIRKISVNDRKVIQLTHDGGSNPAESEDGKTIYYTAGGAIWKVGTDGAGMKEAIPGPIPALTIEVTRDGIYYLGSAKDRGIKFFNFATGRSQTILKLDKGLALGMSISPDGKWLLFTQRDTDTSADLMLVDPFR
jgi:Tol biopolymer transport system component/predicted Ser/Thr protein kinase